MSLRAEASVSPTRLRHVVPFLSLLLVSVSALSPPAAGQVERDAERFQVAIGLLRRDLHDEAAEQFRRFLREHPRHALAAEAWYRLGTCYLELDDAERAVDALRKSLRASGELRFEAECRYRLGKTLQARGDKKGAADEFQKLVAEEKRDHYLWVPAMYAAGECLRDVGRKDDAITAFKTAAAAEGAGQDAQRGQYGMPALYYAGFLAMELGRFEDAAKTFIDAAKSYPRHEARPECLYLEGEAWYRDGRFDRAKPAYERAIRAGGEFVDDARFGLAWCRVKQGDVDGAIDGFEEVIERHGDSPLVVKSRLEAGRLCYKKKRYDDARAHLEPLLEREDLPSVIATSARELCGLANLDDGRAERAVTYFESALKGELDDPTRARVAYNLGEALAESGEHAEAVGAYGLAEKLAGDDDALLGDALYGACFAMHELGRHRPSIAKAKQLVDRLPEHRLAAAARFAIGENYFELKDWRTADEFYARVPDDHSLARKAEFKRAWCAYLAENRKLAAERFTRLAGGKDGFAEESLSMAALSWFQAGRHDDALEAADRYRARHPQGAFLARTERVAAQVLEARGDLKGAANRVARAAGAERAEGRASEDRLQLAEILFKQNDYEGAKKHYSEVASGDGEVAARAVQGLAWCAFELGDDGECIQHVNAALAHPAGKDGRAAMLELLSSVHHRAKRWADAQKAAQRFLAEFAEHPRAAELRFALGVAQARDDKLKDARKTLAALGDGKGLARPDRALYELAWVCRRLEDEPAALAAFAKVAAISKDEDLAGEANLHLGEVALAAERAGEARRLLAKVGGKYRPHALYRLGFSWLAADRPKDALPHFEAIVAMGPERSSFHDEALFMAGESYYRLGEHDDAAERLRRLLGRAPDHERAQTARLRLGECEFVLDSADAAVAVLEQFLSRAGDAPKSELARANLWLGRARMTRGEHDRAEAAFRKTTDLSEGPLAAEAQFRLGQNRLAKGDARGAVDAFLKLSILYAHDDWVQRGLLEASGCYEKLEQPHKAKKLLEELIEKYPKSDAAREARVRLKRLSGD